MAKVDGGSFNSVVAGGEESSAGTFFPLLRHLCVQLLELLQNPKKNSSSPSQLLQLLRQSSPDALQPFFDFFKDALAKANSWFPSNTKLGKGSSVYLSTPLFILLCISHFFVDHYYSKKEFLLLLGL